ncbi:MAG: YggS family pyridoxal phosphate-dependent enzyme [Clostridia bacterium]
MENMIIDNVKFYTEEVAKINKNAEIIAVSKTIDPFFVNIATRNGLKTIGENRVQELLTKINDYDCKNVHFIGHLQTNKVKSIIDKVSLIQSVDSVKLASIIDGYAKNINIKKDILVQINVSNEDSKSGINVENVDEIIQEIQTFENLNIRGFMTIPKNTNDYELEVDFDKMHQIFNRFTDFDILSMGMSRDFRLALKHGSTMVRIGSGIFKGPHPL